MHQWRRAATSVTGNAKDIIATFVGAIAFNDFTPTRYSVSGICISFAGAAAFSWYKLQEMRSTTTTSTPGPRSGSTTAAHVDQKLQTAATTSAPHLDDDSSKGSNASVVDGPTSTPCDSTTAAQTDGTCSTRNADGTDGVSTVSRPGGIIRAAKRL